jgi:hypothetical protein
MIACGTPSRQPRPNCSWPGATAACSTNTVMLVPPTPSGANTSGVPWTRDDERSADKVRQQLRAHGSVGERSMKRVAGFVAAFAAGVLATVALYLLVATRSAPQSAVWLPSLVVTQFEAGGPIVVATQSTAGSLVVVTQVDLPLLPQPSSIVGSGFLFDGLRPQDLPRMNPPRTVPDMTPPTPVPSPPSEFPK